MYALQMDTSTVPPCKVPIAALTSTDIAHTKAVKQTHPMQIKSFLCQANCCACQRCEKRQRLAGGRHKICRDFGSCFRTTEYMQHRLFDFVVHAFDEVCGIFNERSDRVECAPHRRG